MGNTSAHITAARAASFCKVRAKPWKASDAQTHNKQEVSEPLTMNQTDPAMVDVEEADDDELEDLPELEEIPECGICSESLEQGLLHLGCGHTFCEECIQNQLQARWPGSRMSFGYLNCAFCRMPMKHNTLGAQLASHLELQQRAEKVAVQKFRDDGLVEEMQAELVRPASENEIFAEAVRTMAVFQCCDCEEPYCAGRMDCAAVQEHDGKTSRCPECAWTATKDANDHRCMIHGPKYALFKCDSCCNVAVWNCTSHHYCERCHNQAHEKKHYPCPGPELCPLGMAHPPNGEAVHCSEQCASFCIGCTACLGYAEAQDTEVNENISLSFQEMWLKFESGAEVLALLGEKEVRARLQNLQPGQTLSGAQHCADVLLRLSVQNYKRAAEEVKKHADEMRLQRENPEADWRHLEEQEMQRLERERVEAEQEMQRRREIDAKERAVWEEVDKERMMTPMFPDWKILREQDRAKREFRSCARQTQLEYKYKQMQKQKQNRSSSCISSQKKYVSPRQKLERGRACRVFQELSEIQQDWRCEVECSFLIPELYGERVTQFQDATM